MFPIITPFSLLSASANSTANLAQVQAGFSSSASLSDSSLQYIIYVAGAVILVILIAGLLHWRKKKSQTLKIWSSITNSQAIWEILSKAVSRQANFLLDIYQANQTITYKGVLSGIEEDVYLILSLSVSPSVEADFTELPGVIHINFRPAPKETIEHYQFTTKILSLRFVKINTWKEAQLVLPIPKTITSTQRRSFLRLEPTGSFSFNCELFNVPEGNISELDSLEPVCQGEVLDISIGGAQIKLTTSVTLRETQRFLGIINLPSPPELNVELSEPKLILLIQLLNKDFSNTMPQSGQAPHAILRVRFLGRYLKDKIQNIWFYKGLTQASLEDLSHWMLAYQRYLIKKKHNLLNPPAELHRPPNMFPSQPPARPPLKDDWPEP
jgi:hypothetical protein